MTYQEIINSSDVDELKSITGSFMVPVDACATFCRTYELLAKLTEEIIKTA